MKYFFQTLYTLIGLMLLCITWDYVQTGDVCRTVFGCFAMWSWFKFRDKNH